MSYIRSEISNLFKIAHLKFERKKIFQEKTDFRCTFEVIILYDIGQKSTVLNNVQAVREMEQNLCGKKGYRLLSSTTFDKCVVKSNLICWPLLCFVYSCELQQVLVIPRNESCRPVQPIFSQICIKIRDRNFLILVFVFNELINILKVAW